MRYGQIPYEQLDGFALKIYHLCGTVIRWTHESQDHLTFPGSTELINDATALYGYFSELDEYADHYFIALGLAAELDAKSRRIEHLFCAKYQNRVPIEMRFLPSDQLSDNVLEVVKVLLEAKIQSVITIHKTWAYHQECGGYGDYVSISIRNAVNPKIDRCAIFIDEMFEPSHFSSEPHTWRYYGLDEILGRKVEFSVRQHDFGGAQFQEALNDLPTETALKVLSALLKRIQETPRIKKGNKKF